MSEPEDPSFRWRPLSYLLLGFAVVLFAAGVAGRNPVPILVAFPLLLAPIVAPLVGPRRSPRVQVTGQVDGAAGRIDVSLRLTPEPPVYPGDLRVVVPPPREVDERGPPQVCQEGGSLRLQLAWSVPHPTVASIPVPLVRWEDALGLVERPAEASGEPLSIERYPPELHRAGVVRLEHTIALPGETRSRAIGSTGEFFGIREAALHDPPRLINWLASARAGRRLANEYALDRNGDVLLLLDARPTSLGPSIDARLLGISRAAAYGLADAFLREKTRVALGVYGEFLTILAPADRTHPPPSDPRDAVPDLALRCQWPGGEVRRDAAALPRSRHDDDRTLLARGRRVDAPRPPPSTARLSPGRYRVRRTCPWRRSRPT